MDKKEIISIGFVIGISFTSLLEAFYLFITFLPNFDISLGLKIIMKMVIWEIHLTLEPY